MMIETAAGPCAATGCLDALNTTLTRVKHDFGSPNIEGKRVNKGTNKSAELSCSYENLFQSRVRIRQGL